jgi:hypothetical protein
VLRSRDEAEGSEAAPVLGLKRADWLLENARVVTLDPRCPVAQAIAVAGGRVAAIGRGTDLRRLAGASTERLDCGGATVLPGLVDPHLHLFALAAHDAHLDCAAAGVRTVDDLLAAVRADAERLPPGAWVRGERLDEVRLGRLPTAAELDRAAPANPVRLRHRSRHASVLSGRALRLLAPLPGGSTPRGLVAGREAAIGRLVGPLAASTLEKGLASAARELAAQGLVAVADATPRAWHALAPLRTVLAAGRFPLRVYAMRRPGSRGWRAVGRLRPGAVKILVEEETYGLRPEPPALARMVRAAAAAGDQVAVHCLGVATLVAALAAFAALPSRLRDGRRHRLEHLAECPAALVGRVAALGLSVVTNPAFVHWRGDVYRTETAAGARSWLYRARTLASAGVPLAGASDAPVVPPSPWIGIAAARSRRTSGGEVLGAAERLGPEAALRLFTTGAAFALHDDVLGRLRVGGPAHLIVVDPDPLRAPPDEVADVRVRLTLVDGKRAWPT